MGDGASMLARIVEAVARGEGFALACLDPRDVLRAWFACDEPDTLCHALEVMPHTAKVIRRWNAAWDAWGRRPCASCETSRVSEPTSAFTRTHCPPCAAHIRERVPYALSLVELRAAADARRLRTPA